MIQDIGWNIDNSYITLPNIFYSNVKPNPVKDAKLLMVNEKLAEKLGLDIERLKEPESIDIFAGNRGLIENKLIAQAYAGHQFGHFTMLGDGRAILLGEQISPSGGKLDIQLKGSGITPYSRGGDGRAALGPMLREYIISEAMYALNIPTTRSLAVVTTGEKVYRETPLDGAILTRVAKSHIRVGTFEFAAKYATKGHLKALADYTIGRHFLNIKDDENIYISLVKEVMKLQASLISKWQAVGFIHGVMNTDNMSISGETIDYGPCAFMNNYDPSTVFSSIDRNGRYAYGNQPNIGGWNIARFVETLLPLISEDSEQSIKLAKKAINQYEFMFYNKWLEEMRLKLGISNEEADDNILIDELLSIMKNYGSDFTNIFIGLTDEKYQRLDETGLFKSDEIKDWNTRWIKRLERQDRSIETSKEYMKKYNPTIIPRNHQVERALADAVENGEYTLFNNLLNALRSPFDYDNIKEEYMTPPQNNSDQYKTYCGT